MAVKIPDPGNKSPEATASFDAGVLLVDKPAWKTSFAMIKAVRRLTGIKKVGHAGTLDPFATGLLVICVGRTATRMIPSFMDGEKEYVATLELGKTSTTLDPEGEITSGELLRDYSEGDIEQIIDQFRGSIMQKPPAYSALKHKGKPLYHYARQGIMIEKSPREVHIHQLDWLDRRALVKSDHPLLSLRVRCSKGTYIRTLADDIGHALGCGAYLISLRRTQSGFFSVEQSVSGTDLYGDEGVALVQNKLISVVDVQKLLQKDHGMANVTCSS